MFGELVVSLTPTTSDDLRYLRKTNMQLASKMRFISAQFLELLSDDLWLENAVHANVMARRLAVGLREIDDVEIVVPVDANAIFATLPPERLQETCDRFGTHVVSQKLQVVRIMTSFDTTEDDVDALIDFLST